MSKPRLRWDTGKWRLVKHGQHSNGYRWSMLNRNYVVRRCAICGQEWIAHVSAQICHACRPGYGAAQRRAVGLVNRAVRQGKLLALTGRVPCVDCGAPALHYDHRDYSRPLDVVPTCRSCNGRRGVSRHELRPDIYPPDEYRAA